ncbi:MAG: hypothetical protein ACRDRR_03035 [Pseudonocardiaceae bacterium]
MVRRRERPPDQPHQGERPPLCFRYRDWADEAEVPPAHWREGDRRPDWHHVRALRRYLDAGRAWREANGVTWEQWQAMRRPE